jgi:hypothetical protein
MFYTLRTYEILWTCTQLTYEQEFQVPKPIPTLESGFLGLQNSAVPLGHGRKKLFFQL